MKMYGGVDTYIHVFLTLALVEGGGQLHVVGKEPQYPSDRGLGRPKNWSVQRQEEKKSCPYQGLSSDPSGTHCSRLLYQQHYSINKISTAHYLLYLY
jgi:hypothetical protein